MYILQILAWSMLHAPHATQDMFSAYDCSNPSGITYIPHQDCHLPSNSLEKEQFSILQVQKVKKVEAHECSVTITTAISFCGAYSHTKETGASTFNVPQVVPPQRCKEMVDTGSFATNDMSFPIKIGGLNYLTYVEKGSIQLTGTNIHCTGEPLRMADGRVNHNMLKTQHIIVHIHKLNLTVTRGPVIHPDSQVTIAPDCEFVSNMPVRQGL